MLVERAPEMLLDLSTDGREPISPELALVDPELARRARESLPARPPFPPLRVIPFSPPVEVTAPALASPPGAPAWRPS
ncbi:MAG: hypothetical protein H0V45_03405, partial [Actinobacteria bacterium]|nr:hypothetical protein [Actinomycetota bacterium]